MTERIALLGAGALARDFISTYGQAKFSIAYVDPDCRGGETHVCGLEIESSWHRIIACASHYVLAVGDQKARSMMQVRARAHGLMPCEPLVYPAAFVAQTASLGRGSVVGRFSVVGENVEVSEDVLIMHQSSIGHDSRMGELSVVCPGVTLGGGTNMGRNCFVGGNAVTAPRVTIGDDAMISAGAFCLVDVPTGSLAIGNPARRVARTA